MGNGHVDRRDEHPRQRPRDPAVDGARGARGGERLRRPPKAILRAQASRAPWPAQSCASCTRAPGITPRATHRAQPHVLLAPSSRPPVPVVPARGRRRHAARPPAHTRAGECRALVGSGGSRAHRASSTCAGRSRRATAWRSSPTAPPAPDGEPPGWRTPSATRPPAVPPDLDLRHRRCHEEDLLLCGEGGSWRRRSVRRDAPTIGGRRGHLGRRPSRAHTRQPRREPCAPRPSRSRRGSAADRRSRGERAAAPGDGGLFLQTGAATAGGLPWATAAAVRERGAAAAAAPGVTVHYKRAQEPGSA